jgi:hypothetical protein
MIAMKIKLAHIEARIQSLVEGSAAWLFPSKRHQANLASRLLEAMYSGVKPGVESLPVAPNLYTLTVNTTQVKAIMENRTLIEGLARMLKEAGQEANFKFPGPVAIHILGNDTIPLGDVRVVARNSRENLAQTSDLGLDQWDELNSLPLNAFLIVDGTRIFPLQSAVVNIGRRSDNQLFIDDPRVSRTHAQLRAVKGHYILFDLNSTGGTFVNGTRISKSSLRPGDVISLSGVPLVFGQDTTGAGETQDYDPSLSKPVDKPPDPGSKASRENK